jgi:hypothetical protein
MIPAEIMLSSMCRLAPASRFRGGDQNGARARALFAQSAPAQLFAGGASTETPLRLREIPA